MKTFKVGDLVRLKSGGPVMTVASVGQSVHCQWFAGAKLEKGFFDAESLENAPAKQPTKEKSG
jgi:uncharacterized protein YodC (DUF2158 family)